MSVKQSDQEREKQLCWNTETGCFSSNMNHICCRLFPPEITIKIEDLFMSVSLGYLLLFNRNI